MSHHHQQLNCVLHSRVGYRLTGYEGLESPKMGSSPKFSGSPKYSEETVTCDSDGKPGHEAQDYIKGINDPWINTLHRKQKIALLSRVSINKVFLLDLVGIIHDGYLYWIIACSISANGTVAHYGGLSDDALSLSVTKRDA